MAHDDSERVVPGILRHTNFVADKFDLRRDYVFETQVTSASFNEVGNQWIMKWDPGDEAPTDKADCRGRYARTVSRKTLRGMAGQAWAGGLLD